MVCRPRQEMVIVLVQDFVLLTLRRTIILRVPLSPHNTVGTPTSFRQVFSPREK